VQSPTPAREQAALPSPQAPLLITGATGVVGQALARACAWRGVPYVLTDRAALTLGDAASEQRGLRRHQPWAVINAASNAGGLSLARACAAAEIPYVGFFGDPPRNEAEATAEQALTALGGKTLIVRTSPLFSPFDSRNFAARVVQSLAAGRTVSAADGKPISPTYLPDLAEAVLDLVIDGAVGLWPLITPGALTWFAFAQAIASAVGLDPEGVIRAPVRDPDMRAVVGAPPPSRGTLLPSLENAIARYAGLLKESGFEAEAPMAWPQADLRTLEPLS
jgi:dTDP-4-dehydrorhamnose reductase